MAEVIRIQLPDSFVTFVYDSDTHTLTLEGARMAFVSDDDMPDAWLVQQFADARMEIVLLHPTWQFAA